MIISVLLVKTVPCNFCECGKSGQQAVLYLLHCFYVFAPKASLNTFNVCSISLGHIAEDRIKVIYFSYGIISRQIEHIHCAEVKLSARSHDYIVSLFSRFCTIFRISPCHNSSIGCRSSGKNLIPAYNAPSVFLNKFFHFGHKVALQFVLCFILLGIFPSLSLDKGLTFGTFLPTVARTLVSTNVNVA